MNQFITEVAAQARGKWGFILDALAISHSKQHSPCPACGGKDRFRFDDRQGAGTWFVISANHNPATVWIWLKMSDNAR